MKYILVLLGVVLVIFLVMLGVLYSQIGRYQSFWNRNNTRESATNEMAYIAFGDSTAQGIGATSPLKGYVGQIAKQIESKNNRQVRIINLSKSGAKVRDVIDTQLPAYDKLQLPSQRIITMEIGANDMLDFKSERFEKDMDLLLSKMPKETVISDIPYFGFSRLKKHQPSVEQANEIMARLASKHDFDLVPLHDKLKNNSSPRIYAIDWFHPSNYAYRELWVPVFLGGIERNSSGR